MTQRKLTARDLDAARELPVEPCHVVAVKNGHAERLLGTRHGIDASSLPPLDIPQETEPPHTGRNWKAKAPTRKRDRYWRELGWFIAHVIATVIFVALLLGVSTGVIE